LIYYVCHPAHTYTCAVILLWYGDELRPVFRFVPYGVLGLLRKAGSGVVIWTDFDRLDSQQRKDAARLRSELQRDDLLQLNHPLESELRFEMLSRLHRHGINRFGVRRVYETLDGLRYPVFLRDEVGAGKKTPELLSDRAALESAIAGLVSSDWANPMIVEFGVWPAADGFYRKYGAFRVGDQIFPQHMLASLNWFIKRQGDLSRAHYPEHLQYIEQNPHAAELRKLFDQAKVQYGRMDYTLVGGCVQVFEINTNPAVLDKPPTPEDEFDPGPYGRRHIEALLALPNATVRATNVAIDFVHEMKLKEVKEFYGGDM
jgi:hypothetical protein